MLLQYNSYSKLVMYNKNIFTSLQQFLCLWLQIVQTINEEKLWLMLFEGFLKIHHDAGQSGINIM